MTDISETLDISATKNYKKVISNKIPEKIICLEMQLKKLTNFMTLT